MSATSDNKKDLRRWWAPVWQGLVMDPQAKHYHRMGQAIWLFLYFIMNANRRTGILMRKTSTISAQTGFKSRTVRQWVRILREASYISTRSTGRYLQIEISLWKNTSRPAEKNQSARPMVASQCDKRLPDHHAGRGQIFPESLRQILRSRPAK